MSHRRVVVGGNTSIIFVFQMPILDISELNSSCTTLEELLLTHKYMDIFKKNISSIIALFLVTVHEQYPQVQLFQVKVMHNN